MKAFLLRRIWLYLFSGVILLYSILLIAQKNNILHKDSHSLINKTEYILKNEA